MPQLLLLFLLIIFPAALIFGVVYLWQNRTYKRSEYFNTTRTPHRTVHKDLGLWGEYLTHLRLSALPGNKKFLFNCYVPKENGTFTEIDLMMLHTSGIYVFESKNYSGWIFGNETARQWTQSFRSGRKVRFFNPLIQNANHIKYLQRFLQGLAQETFQSVIVFSERCELQKITLTSTQHLVIKRNQLPHAIVPYLQRQVFSPDDIETLYQYLLPQTQLTELQKQAHIQRVSDIAEHRVCPYCGSALVVRTARKTGNQFWGCSKYPACKYTASD